MMLDAKWFNNEITVSALHNNILWYTLKINLSYVHQYTSLVLCLSHVKGTVIAIYALEDFFY